ncbi:Uncharacterised protein [Mycobacteroides abscessus subsp. abscessus]|nr:Uncharacterised protein [Mycobacteroides abscessus subsp. abscessus]SKV69550.1 Uncharacterised protein [Mycobacteroides abscessus subsp. abscessus]
MQGSHRPSRTRTDDGYTGHSPAKRSITASLLSP